jgi:hypothetical protein
MWAQYPVQQPFHLPSCARIAPSIRMVKDRPDFAHRYQEMLIALEPNSTPKPTKAMVKKGGAYQEADPLFVQREGLTMSTVQNYLTATYAPQAQKTFLGALESFLAKELPTVAGDRARRAIAQALLTMQDSLLVGCQPLPGGSYTHRIPMKSFRLCSHHSLFLGAVAQQ